MYKWNNTVELTVPANTAVGIHIPSPDPQAVILLQSEDPMDAVGYSYNEMVDEDHRFHHSMANDRQGSQGMGAMLSLGSSIWINSVDAPFALHYAIGIPSKM